MRCRKNVGGRDHIAVTNDHKLAFVVRKHKQIFFIVFARLLMHTYNKLSILLCCLLHTRARARARARATLLGNNLQLLTGIYNQDTRIRRHLIITFLSYFAAHLNMLLTGAARFNHLSYHGAVLTLGVFFSFAQLSC